ncbi:hypothetical protein ACFQDG_10870 [Natronoarchaeum mannanilyticum]|uniref:Uncharacterized protein n=1 Tax=Natronoarchaeum mannanilyticum TaxID=926360 RepID=A0AAV3T5Z7_9EURY
MGGGEDEYVLRGQKISILQMLQGRSVYESEDADPCPVESIIQCYSWKDEYNEENMREMIESLHQDPSSPLNYCNEEETHIILNNPRVTKTFINTLKEKQRTR